MDFALMLPIALMVVQAKPVNMGQIPSIAMAAYTTCKIVMAFIHIRRKEYRSSRNILVTELRTINVIDALVSVLTLQNTLIMVNQTKDGSQDMFRVSAASSAMIYIAVIVITIRMLQKGWKQLRCDRVSRISRDGKATPPS